MKISTCYNWLCILHIGWCEAHSATQQVGSTTITHQHNLWQVIIATSTNTSWSSAYLLLRWNKNKPEKKNQVRRFWTNQWQWSSESRKHLRFLRVLLSPADESVFVRLSVAGESVDLRVGPQGAFVVHATAADGPDASRVHRLTAVLHSGHGSKRANASWLARVANVSELVDSPKSQLLLCICCPTKPRRRHDSRTGEKLPTYCFVCKCSVPSNVTKEPQ